MEKGTNEYGKGQVTDSAPSEYIGSVFLVPNTTTSYARSSNAQGYQQVAKMNNENKITGSYERCTARKEFSTGEQYRARGSGQYGVKDEYKSSVTVKVGDKSGYTEYYKEERVRNVSYDGSSHSNNYGGSKSVGYDQGASKHYNTVATNKYNTYYESEFDTDTYYEYESDSD